MQNLPSELRGRIFSQTSANMVKVLKCVNKETFYDMRYITHLYDEVGMKSIFIKHKEDNKKSLFYYNLKRINNLIIITNKEELNLVPILLDKVDSVIINYDGDRNIDGRHNILESLFLIPMFIKSKCQYMKIFAQYSWHILDKIKYTLKKRDGCIILNMSCDNELMKCIEQYITGINSLHISNKCTILQLEHIREFLLKTNIKILRISFFNFNIENLLNIVQEIYIADFYETFSMAESVFPNIKNVTFKDESLPISNEDIDLDYPYYKKFCSMFPNAKISVFKFNDWDVINERNVNIITDVTKVLILGTQKLDTLIINNKPKFPNLKRISDIKITKEFYETSVDLLKIIAHKLNSLFITLQGVGKLPYDILKYLQLFEDTKCVTEDLFLWNKLTHLFNISIKYDNQIIIDLMDYNHKVGKIDLQYVNTARTVVYISDYSDVYKAYKFVTNAKIHKLRFTSNSFLGSNVDLPRIVDTLYLEKYELLPSPCYISIQFHITKVIFISSKSFEIDVSWNAIFPNATFTFI